MSSGESGSSATPTTKISLDRRRKLCGSAASTALSTTRTFGSMSVASRTRSRCTGYPRAASSVETPSRNQAVSTPPAPSTTATPFGRAEAIGLGPSRAATASAMLLLWFDDQLEPLHPDDAERVALLDLPVAAASRPRLAPSIGDARRGNECLGSPSGSHQRCNRERGRPVCAHLEQPTDEQEEVREAEDDRSHDQDRAEAERDRVFDVACGVEGECAQHEADDPARRQEAVTREVQ